MVVRLVQMCLFVCEYCMLLFSCCTLYIRMNYRHHTSPKFHYKDWEMVISRVEWLWKVNYLCVVMNCNIKHLHISLFIFVNVCATMCVPSMLWHCWLGVRKGIRPVKIWLIRCWRGYLLEQSENSLHMVQLMPLPPQSLLQQNPEWFVLLVQLTWVVPDKML